ncbi:MAG TPA: hypothetical protein VNQ76_19410, partial [Planctomicrobium sp.]|nr:hypothetical protein [Planctomicrobium sp.]
YKAKNFIDTAVYRANDAGSAWIIALIRSVGWSAIWWVAIPVTVIWIGLCSVVGSRRNGSQHQEDETDTREMDSVHLSGSATVSSVRIG